VAAYKPVGRTMTKASLVGTLGSLMGVAPLILEGRLHADWVRWRAPVQLTQVVVSNSAWIGSHIRMLYMEYHCGCQSRCWFQNQRKSYFQGMGAWARGDHMAEEAKWLVHQQELHAVLMGFKAFEPMLAKRMVECQVEGTEAQSYMNQLT